jgi:hypothetical protein
MDYKIVINIQTNVVINGKVVSRWFPVFPVWQSPESSFKNLLLSQCVVTMSYG